MLSADHLPKTRLDAIKFYERYLVGAASKGPTHLQEAKRWLGRNDLFFLLTYYCRRKDIAEHDWLFDRCREVQAEPNGCLDLWARDHYKSTIITFGLTVQDILASHGSDAEKRYDGREITVGIFSHTSPIAKKFLGQMKREFEVNEPLKRDFEDVLYWAPKREAPGWSLDGGIIVKRLTNPKEATVEAHGLVDGQPTGKHYFLRVYDDVVTLESVYTADQIRKTTNAWEISDNLGTKGGWKRHIGTRYHHFDTYQTMIDRKVVKPRVHAATKDGTEQGEPVLLSKPELAEKRKTQGPYNFAAQMLLNPTADKAQGFQEPWLRFWKANNRTALNFVILVDPASGRKKQEAKNDFTTMWVVGLAADRNFMVVDIVRDRLNLSGRAKALMGLHRKWRPLAVGYEQVGMQADIEHIGTVQDSENYRFQITEISPNGVPKVDRIKRLQPLFEAGRIYLPDTLTRLDWEGKAVDLVRAFIEEEYRPFPVLAHDDMLDGLSQLESGQLVLTWPEPEERTAAEEAYEEERQSEYDWSTI